MEALDACALVSFATKFEVDGLMGVCEKQMKDGLTHEVVFDVLHVVFSKAVESEGMRVFFFFFFDDPYSCFCLIPPPPLNTKDLRKVCLRFCCCQLRISRFNFFEKDRIGFYFVWFWLRFGLGLISLK